jgi:miniconductance mechanosensitive channel
VFFSTVLQFSAILISVKFEKIRKKLILDIQKEEFVMDFLKMLQEIREPHPVIYSTVTALFLLFAASVISLLIRLMLLCGLRKLFRFLPKTESAEYPVCVDIVTYAVNIFPVAFLAAVSQSIPGIAPAPALLLRNMANAFVILFAALALARILDLAGIFYKRHSHAAMRPVKGYIQLIKICLGCVAFILITATLVNKNPLLLLSGLGAMAAVILLIFQDTLLSVVASLQLLSDDMIRLGDWIEMPSQNTDGNVVEIALHTIKVRNWDNTISTLPVRKLITDSFKNWRGMVDSGGRRIKRSLFIDQTSIHFLSPEELEKLRQLSLLQTYFAEQRNTGNLTNFGAFRIYVVRYLQNSPDIRRDMTLLVRQLQPGATGIPLEIYCFTQTVEWVPYEDIQSALFDHLLAILPQFGLRVFQEFSDIPLKKL